MTTAIAHPGVPVQVQPFLEELSRLELSARTVRAESLKRGWGDGAGEISVFAGNVAIDAVLDLYSLALGGGLQQAAGECENFLRDIAVRPGAVTTDEIESFCARAREIAAS